MNEQNVASKLLELFDTLSREFHSLNVTYEKLQNNLNQLSLSNQNVIDTKQLVNEINRDVRLTRDICTRLEIASNELLAYKNSVQSLPDSIITKIQNVLTEIQDAKLKMAGFVTVYSDHLKKFDDDFFKSIKKIEDVNALREELKPVTKLSKLIVTPVGVIAFLLAFTLSVSAIVTGLYQIAKLWAPVQSTDKETIIRIEKDVNKLLESFKLNEKEKRGVSDNPSVSPTNRSPITL